MSIFDQPQILMNMFLLSTIIQLLKPKKYIDHSTTYDRLEKIIKHKIPIVHLKEIQPPYYIQLGEHFKTVFKKFPNHTLKYHRGNKSIKVLYFKIRKHDLKLYGKVHFYHNKAFLIQYRVPYINEQNLEKIEPFFNFEDLNLYSLQEGIIKDSHENFISISNNVNLTIHYIDKETLCTINHTLHNSNEKLDYTCSSIKRAYSYE